MGTMGMMWGPRGQHGVETTAMGTTWGPFGGYADNGMTQGQHGDDGDNVGTHGDHGDNIGWRPRRQRRP